MTPGTVEAELARGRALLSLKRTRVEITETAAPWDGPAMGALAAVGLAAAGLPARLGIYVFEDGAAAQAAAVSLRTALRAEGGEAAAGTNGALMFIGHLKDATSAEELILDRISSAFAGDE